MLPGNEINGGRKLKNGRLDIAMTVDLEEWHHGLKVPSGRSQVVEDTVWLLEAFVQEDVHATFFVLGDVAKKHPRLIRRISETGHEIAFHGAEHVFLSELTPEHFRQDLSEWLPRLEDITGKKVFGFRAPFFSVVPKTIWALEILAENGIEYDSSIYPGVNDRYGWMGAPQYPTRFRDSSLVLFPVPFLHRKLPIAFSGGAYLRILPWFVVRWGFAHQRVMNKIGMIYVHPWEVTRALPKPVRASWRANVTRYPGRKNMRRRVEALIAAECPRMGTMKDVIADMPEIPVWNL